MALARLRPHGSAAQVVQSVLGQGPEALRLAAPGAGCHGSRGAHHEALPRGKLRAGLRDTPGAVRSAREVRLHP